MVDDMAQNRLDNKMTKAKMRKMARVGCNKCYGRGYIGYWHDTARPVICSCVINRYRRLTMKPDMYQ